MNLVVDIETDSLDATKIHCIVARNMETNENMLLLVAIVMISFLRL